jgi:hypothetical protein
MPTVLSHLNFLPQTTPIMQPSNFQVQAGLKPRFWSYGLLHLVALHDATIQNTMTYILQKKHLHQCFPTRILQIIIRGFLRNRGISPMLPREEEHCGEYSS